MELGNEPPVKRSKQLSSTVCIICEKPIDEHAGVKSVVRTPTTEGIHSFLSAAEKPQDDVYQRIYPYMQDIQIGNVSLAFHKNCRASYTN